MLHTVCSVSTQLRSRTSTISNVLKTLYSTGIEHAEAMKEVVIGMKKKVNPEEYKCSDYFNFEKYSYCDLEVSSFVHLQLQLMTSGYL
uniref:NADH dehydrogenase [ubiquinone] flavoprotein 3, mitochondrial n=1 Tax=Elaeophora elaphi TaxID=1147741 RepID=A0A0R3RYJ8_9BILA